jgi:dihydroxyacetone kinase phosphotransfer subunit
MVSLVLLSHSRKIVEGAKELALQMGGEANILAVGGTKDGALGADFDATLEALQQAAAQGDVVVLADLGSARMTGGMAKDALDPPLQEHVHLCDAALVEGALLAAVSIAGGDSVQAVLEGLQPLVLDKD